MKFLLNIASIITALNNSIGKLTSWLTLFMVLVTFTIVVMRYIFNEGSIAIQESITYMHAIVFLFAAAYTLNSDGHVRVDIFYGKMSDLKKAIINLLGNIFLLLPTCLFIIWSGWEYVLDSWELKERSREAGGLDGVYLLKSCMLIMAGLLVLQAISNILQNVSDIFFKKPATEQENN